MAPSGAGKTTLLRLLLGLVKPDGGSISPAGAKLSCAFQEERLVPGLSAVGNVLLACPCTRAQAESAFGALGFEAHTMHQPVCELSGGQQRRVSLARAMLADSAAVLLDEPFKGLDDEGKGRCRRLCARKCRGARRGVRDARRRRCRPACSAHRDAFWRQAAARGPWPAETVSRNLKRKHIARPCGRRFPAAADGCRANLAEGGSPFFLRQGETETRRFRPLFPAMRRGALSAPARPLAKPVCRAHRAAAGKYFL